MHAIHLRMPKHVVGSTKYKNYGGCTQ